LVSFVSIVGTVARFRSHQFKSNPGAAQSVMSQTQVETLYRGPNAANVNIPKYVQVAETTHERE
jgi:hypothetical protein